MMLWAIKGKRVNFYLKNYILYKKIHNGAKFYLKQHSNIQSSISFVTKIFNIYSDHFKDE